MSFRVVAAAILAIVAVPAVARAPSQIVVFGDSLVDAGNVFLATGGFAPTNIYNNPSRGYFPGRFTNGPDYTDLLSLKLFGTLSRASLAGGSNYAFGLAKVVTDADPVPDLTAQLGLYSAGHPLADPNALYIINAGGNDDFAVEGGTPAQKAAAANNIANTLAGAVQFLDSRGATRILVTGIPNTTATGFGLDTVLQARLDAIEPGLVNADLKRFSYLSFFTRLAMNPAAFRVPAFTQAGACFDHVSPPAPGVLPDCSGYFSVDGVHPIAPIQAAIFREVVQTAGVPEPASWTLMIAGFGLIGSALRRRTAVAA